MSSDITGWMPGQEASPDIERFRGLFWEAFASLRARSVRYDELRGDLELASDWLAGPLSSIYESGACDYVFEDSARFPGISNAEKFLEWCLEAVGDFRKIVSSVTPATSEEQADHRRYVQIAVKMEELSRIAYELVKRREGSRQS